MSLSDTLICLAETASFACSREGVYTRAASYCLYDCMLGGMQLIESAQQPSVGLSVLGRLAPLQPNFQST